MNGLAKQVKYCEETARQLVRSELYSYFNRISERDYGDRNRIGIESEFPILSLDGKRPCVDVLKQLISEISVELNFDAGAWSTCGTLIKSRCVLTGDTLSFEFSYSTLEFSLSPTSNLHDAQTRLEHYLAIARTILSNHGLVIAGAGINNSAWIESIPHISCPHYDAVSIYLSTCGDKRKRFFNPHFNKFICSTQTHIEVGQKDIAPITNLINATAWIRAILFANSPFSDRGMTTFIARDQYWRDSAFCRGQLSIGTQSDQYLTYQDILDEYVDRPFYMAQREAKNILLPGCSLYDLLCGRKLTGLSIVDRQNLTKVEFRGDRSDLENFRSYIDVCPTKFGTLEIRNDCQQPFDQLFGPAAFHAGLLQNLEEATAYLRQSVPNYSPRYLRDQAAVYGYGLCQLIDVDIVKVIKGCLDIARNGLVKKLQNEERLLDPAYDNFNARTNPAMKARAEIRSYLYPHQSVSENKL